MTKPSATPAARSAVVFGGSGFIGTHLLKELAESGFDQLKCVDLVRAKSPVDGVNYVTGDVREPIHLDGTFDVAYNFAAVHRTPGHPAEEYFETNVAGAINVTNFCRAN